MPKKFVGENSKAVVARERKAEIKKAEVDKKQKAADDALWADDDKHAAKKQQRKEEEEKKRIEALKRKEELRQAYDEDMKNAGASVAAAKAAPAKVTRAQLAARAEAMMRAMAEQDRLREQQAKKIQEVDHLAENVNRLELEQATARNVEEAISVLGESGEEVGPDKHPEKRMRAAYQTFEDVRLPQLKSEHPTFRLSQLKQILRKEWQKSPQNPLNVLA